MIYAACNAVVGVAPQTHTHLIDSDVLVLHFTSTLPVFLHPMMITVMTTASTPMIIIIIIICSCPSC